MPTNQHLSPLIREVFVLRLWSRLPTQPWVGEIQHVRSGQIVHVRNAEELLAYIEAQMESPYPPPTDGA